jgi:hypothetical protein
MNINKVVKRGPRRKQYDPKQQGCEKGGHYENNTTLNNKVVKRGRDENNMTINNNVVKKGT